MSNICTMSEQRRKAAIDNVIKSLELNHMNFGFDNRDELAVIEEGMRLLKFVEEYTDLPLWFIGSMNGIEEC